MYDFINGKIKRQLGRGPVKIAKVLHKLVTTHHQYLDL